LGFLLGACLDEIGVLCLRQAHITRKLEEKKKESHVTPKSFLKRCVKCGMEIPIASEQCPYCGEKQLNMRASLFLLNYEAERE
jgi:predicted RNA-binding Zn-ribbon protein involved in translation (DUF1610 family)